MAAARRRCAAVGGAASACNKWAWWGDGEMLMSMKWVEMSNVADGLCRWVGLNLMSMGCLVLLMVLFGQWCC